MLGCKRSHFPVFAKPLNHISMEQIYTGIDMSKDSFVVASPVKKQIQNTGLYSGRVGWFKMKSKVQAYIRYW
jgi:hypothetical protein